MGSIAKIRGVGMQRESKITELSVKIAKSEQARAMMWPSVKSWGRCTQEHSAGKCCFANTVL